MVQNGNAFDQKSLKLGHARKVWRSVRHVYPAGGTVSNVGDFVSAGIIKSGTPVKFDSATKTIKAFTDAQVSGASDVNSLGINGFLQEDTPISSASTVATGTVVYAGEIYSYMFSQAVFAKLKSLSGVPMIVFVN